MLKQMNTSDAVPFQKEIQLSIIKYLNCCYLPKNIKGHLCSGLQIYGGPRSLSHDFKIWPITFQGSGPSGPILLVVKKSHFNKNIHLTASLRTPQNRKFM